MTHFVKFALILSLSLSLFSNLANLMSCCFFMLFVDLYCHEISVLYKLEHVEKLKEFKFIEYQIMMKDVQISRHVILTIIQLHLWE